jgi:transposase
MGFCKADTFLPYIELGPTYYEEHKRETVIKQSIKKLKSLGHKVTVEPVA